MEDNLIRRKGKECIMSGGLGQAYGQQTVKMHLQQLIYTHIHFSDHRCFQQ